MHPATHSHSQAGRRLHRGWSWRGDDRAVARACRPFRLAIDERLYDLV